MIGLGRAVDPFRRLVIAVGLVFAPAIAHAAGKRSVVVLVAPASDWRAEALVRTLTADLADDRLAPRAAPVCSGPCDDDALRTAGIELVVRAALDGPATVGYELHALWPGAPGPVRGAIALRGLDRTGFAGVLRDRLHRMARTTGEDAAGAEGAEGPGRDTSSELPGIGEVAAGLGLVLAVLALPIAYGLVRSRRLVARAAAGRTLAGIASLAAVALAVAAIAPANGRGVLLAAGGIAWGTFAAVTLPVVFPPLVGLGRADYDELVRVFAGWAGLVVQRAVLVALVYAPVVLAMVLLGDALAGDEVVRFAPVLPVALLVARQCVRLAAAVAAERLDAALIDASTDPAAWQGAVRGYFTGYLKRSGLAVDDDLLERLTVLPAVGDEVCVYGGGATHPRIAIPRKLLELALAPWGRPHDYGAPRVSTLHWTQWNAGLVMATEPGAVVATFEQRQPRETTTEGDPSENAREHLGEPPTLAGIIEPRALDPRTSYRPHDDPAWLDWDPGEDYDGTDVSDRDFLFGVLVHAVAQIHRHADRFGTVALALRRAGKPIAPLAAPLGRLLERMSDGVGDDHAAIAGARHHLVQYLGWLAWQREDRLTKRAYAPELEAMSRTLIAARAEPTRGSLPVAVRARTRLGRLAGLVQGAPAVHTRWRRLAVAGAIAAVVGVAGLAIADAVRYHATYTDPTDATPKSTPENSHGKG